MKQLVFVTLLVVVIGLSGCGREAPTATVSSDNALAITAVFASNRDTKGWDGQEELYVIQGDPANPQRITSNGAWDRQPAWSPDGSKIAFVSDRLERNLEIYVLDVEEALASMEKAIADRKANPKAGKLPLPDTQAVRLTNNNSADYHPEWSPDGSKIAFESHQDGNAEIYVMDADGSNLLNITNSNALDYQPTWSPDGSKIAFASKDRDSFYSQVYVMDADGKNVKRLTDQGSSDYSPTWSPDGKRIAFYSYRDGNPEIYVMDADGSNPVRLTENESYDVDPAWSPDSSKVIFQSHRSGNADIYIADADGSNVERLISNAAGDYDPDWAQ